MHGYAKPEDASLQLKANQKSIKLQKYSKELRYNGMRVVDLLSTTTLR